MKVGAEMEKPALVLTSELIRAARALLRWEQRDLASASSVSLPTIKRLESKPGVMGAHASTVAALRKALEVAGVEFIDENGGGPGVRLRKRQQKKG
jgi:transcriptional regulator with XRE-family HTH domain